MFNKEIRVLDIDLHRLGVQTCEKFRDNKENLLLEAMVGGLGGGRC